MENMANKQNAWFESKLKQLQVDKDEDDIQLALGDRDSSVSTECVVAADAEANSRIVFVIKGGSWVEFRVVIRRLDRNAAAAVMEADKALDDGGGS